MRSKRFVLPIVGVLINAMIAFTGCDGRGGDANSADPKDTSNTHLNTPAPDNNSATNPSTADTAFQKDSSHMKKDSVR